MDKTTMQDPRAILRALPDATRTLVPAPLRGFRAQARHSMVQCWYGNRALHFEAWWRPRLGAIEVGLHFEADPLTNARLLGAMRERSATIRRRLGAAARIEEWDRGWARVWEPLGWEPLTKEGDHIAERLAARLARYIAVLEPLLLDALPAGTAWNE